MENDRPSLPERTSSGLPASIFSASLWQIFSVPLWQDLLRTSVA
jgi:hypothetical protein